LCSACRDHRGLHPFPTRRSSDLAITASAAGLYFGGNGGPSAFVIAAMVVAGCAGGAAWALIPGVLRAFFKTNEIITSLMLNYVADRKSTRLNSSHSQISYAVFCL